MTVSNNDGAGKRTAVLSAAALLSVLLTGCAGEADFAPTFYAHELPSITEYASEAVEVRGEAASDTESSGKNTREDIETTAVTTSVTTVLSASVTTESADTTASLTETVTSSETVSASESVTTAEQTTASSQTEPVTKTESSPAPSETTAAPVTQAPQTAATTAKDPSLPAAPSTFDAEVFSEDLFIGDSISTGYSLYGFLNDKNVFAKVGLNPSTVLTKNVSTIYGEIGVADMLTYTQPKRVYIMLGSNGIQWLSVENMLRSTDSLIQIIHTVTPDAMPVIISVPPVTPGYDSTVPDVDVMSKINEYNLRLSEYCGDNDMLFVNAAAILKDDTGYFNSAYAERDGMHFKSHAYKTLLSKIQTDVLTYERSHAPKEGSAPTETEVTAAETEAAQKESLPETFVTLPEKKEKTDAENKLSD